MKYWCANFESVSCLRHGIEGKFWLMHYQYTDTDGGNRRNRIAVNYRRLLDVKPGDMLVAYLRTNTFYASGKVILPRRSATSNDTTDTIEEYLKRHEAYEEGYVFYRDAVAYENHIDPWRHDEWESSYPVRIDVNSWEHYVPGGVEVRVVNEISLPQRQIALFELTNDQYDRIAAKLQAASTCPPAAAE